METKFTTGDIVGSTYHTILVIKVRETTFSGIVLASNDEADVVGTYFKYWIKACFKLLDVKLTNLITQGQYPIKDQIIPSQCQDK